MLRARLETPEGKGRFRLQLLLRDPARYQIRATHPLLFNRRLWSLDVVGEEAHLVDYLQRKSCYYKGPAEIAALPLGSLPFARLPALLLGYLPRDPAGPVQIGHGEIRYSDAEGRKWRADLDAGRVVGWHSTFEGRELGVWVRGEEWSEMRAPEEGVRLRWRETVREAGEIELAALRVPRDADQGECDLGWLRGVDDAPWEGER